MLSRCYGAPSQALKERQFKCRSTPVGVEAESRCVCKRVVEDDERQQGLV